MIRLFPRFALAWSEAVPRPVAALAGAPGIPCGGIAGQPRRWLQVAGKRRAARLWEGCARAPEGVRCC